MRGLMRALTKLLAAIALLHFTAALAMSVSPELHALAHSDSATAGHDCAVTAISNGQCDSGPCLVALAPLPAEKGDDSFGGSSRACASFFLSCRVLEHAPPAIS